MIEIVTHHHGDEVVYAIHRLHRHSQRLAEVRLPSTATLDEVVAELAKAADGVALVDDLIREEA